MPDYRRPHLPGGTFFFTVNLGDRRQRLLVDHIETLRAAVAAIRTKRPFEINASVILPDHLHMIWTLPKGDGDFSTRWRLIKHRFSIAINATQPMTSSKRNKRERGIWQRRFYDHLIRDEQDFYQHTEYIHFNPVKHGHVAKPVEWPYSSIHRYIRHGIIDTDWGTIGNVRDLDLD